MAETGLSLQSAPSSTMREFPDRCGYGANVRFGEPFYKPWFSEGCVEPKKPTGTKVDL